MIYSVGKKIIITNNEYIVGERYYDMDACTQNTQPVTANTSSTATDAQIAKCKAEKTTELIQERSVLFKEDVLNESIRTVLFLILLLIHYPRFMNQRSDKPLKNLTNQ